MTVLNHAKHYTKRGWRVVPIPFQGKNPGFKQWEQLRLTLETLPKYFNGRPQNVGLLTGEPSNWVVDVDLDHLLAVELADQFLSPTQCIFGRTGKPRSHRLYRVTSPTKSKQHKSKSAGMIVELRATGMQTVLPLVFTRAASRLRGKMRMLSLQTQIRSCCMNRFGCLPRP